ncbi:MAG TPA: hemerythrin domain-containing protein [Burkholderiales bacterium]|jgi:hemerythrin superfamily protein
MANRSPSRAAKSGRPSAYAGTATTRKLAGRKTAAKRAAPARAPAAPDAIALLRADHKLVTELFGKFDKMKGDGPQKKALVERICNELTVHTKIEEEIFYPAARPAIKDGDMMDEALVEHNGAKQLIAQLRNLQPGEDMYDAKVTVLSEYIKHHVKEEQNEMFPKVKKTKLDLKALGQEMMARKQALMANIERIGQMGR